MLQPVETRQLLISSTWQPEPFSRLGTHYQRHLWRWYLPNLKHLNMFSIGGRKIRKRQYMGIYWYVLCLMDCQNLYMTYRIVPALKALFNMFLFLESIWSPPCTEVEQNFVLCTSRFSNWGVILELSAPCSVLHCLAHVWKDFWFPATKNLNMFQEPTKHVDNLTNQM